MSGQSAALSLKEAKAMQERTQACSYKSEKKSTKTESMPKKMK